MKNLNSNLNINNFVSLDCVRREMIQESLLDRLRNDKEEMDRSPKIINGQSIKRQFEPFDEILPQVEEISEGVYQVQRTRFDLNDASLREFVRRNRIPVKLLPSTYKFEKSLQPYDWIFEVMGVKQRVSSSNLIIIPGVNYSSNRFVICMLLQMKKHKDDGNMYQYWRKAWKLMSVKSYQLMALMHVFKGCERKMKYDQVLKLLEEVNELVANRSFSIDFKRVYIPKTDNKWRPLGVPTKSWRIYLHMLNNIIVWSRLDYDNYQHGYLPNKGVITAWIDVFKLIDSENIYEVDLEKFFDNVKLDNLEELLISELNYPSEIASFLKKMNQSLIKLNHPESEDKIPEPDRNVRFNPNGTPYEFFNPESQNPQDFKQNGVGQGAGTSCGLSTLVLKDVTSSNCTAVKYADDFVIFSNSKIKEEDLSITDETKGIFKNEKKSGWVKRDGVWLKPLKFLGLVWDPSKLELSSDTRKGVTQPLGIKEKLILLALEERKRLLKSNSNVSKSAGSIENWLQELLNNIDTFKLSEISRSRYFGKFLAYLFKGNWENKIGSKSLKVVRHSWVYTYWGQMHYNYLSSFSWIPLAKVYIETLSNEIEDRKIKEENINEKKLNKKVRELESLKQAVDLLTEDKLDSLKVLFKENSDAELDWPVATDCEEEDIKAWKAIMKLFKLDISNSSTWFAEYILNPYRFKDPSIKYPRLYYPKVRGKKVVRTGKSLIR